MSPGRSLEHHAPTGDFDAAPVRRLVQARLEHILLRRLGPGEGVAKVVLVFASDDAAYVCRRALVADGGLIL
ncbi:MAG: hypothetical protein JNK82_20950 [Myxococcaceae bacterium]|nr:hypothetical protein [Myxococcaceae bacterium]